MLTYGIPPVFPDVCTVSTYSRVCINRVRLSNLLVVSWTGKNIFSLSMFPPENFVSRDRFGRPVPRQPDHVHTQSVWICLFSPGVVPIIFNIIKTGTIYEVISTGIGSIFASHGAGEFNLYWKKTYQCLCIRPCKKREPRKTFVTPRGRYEWGTSGALMDPRLVV